MVKRVLSIIMVLLKVGEMEGRMSKIRGCEMAKTWGCEMIKTFLLMAMVLFNANYCFASENHWQKKDTGIYETSITSIAITSSGKLFASTDKAVYTSNNKGDSWRRLVFLPKSKMMINDIACVDGDYPRIYIATTAGLYRVIDQTGNAERIFKAWGNKRYINCIKIDGVKKEKLYIGTKGGLFVSNDRGKNWKSIGYFKNKEINDIAFLERDIFIAANDGIYKDGELSNSWIRAFAITAEKTAEAENGDSENNYNENEASENRINCLITGKDAKTVYAGTNKGIIISGDKGKSWQKLNDGNLIGRYIEDILIQGPNVIAATKKGVFLPDKSVVSYHVKKLAFDKNSKSIYAATTNGLYRYIFADKKKNKITEKNDYVDFVKRQIKNEPGIQQIQKAVIEYAEVSPDKIKWMRYAAKEKAWLPKVTVGFDYDADNNISIDRAGTNDPDVFIIGPDDKNWGWDVSLSWDLGELIWNDDQANIDVRSKLMVQLRDDILTDVTTLYFERRRLQLDIVNGKYKGKAQHVTMLRLQELTARIDALTGGCLSNEALPWYL